MKHRIRLMLVSAALLVGGFAFTNPMSADAFCLGTLAVHWIEGGEGQENARPNTCDGDNYYRGSVAEHFTSNYDGQCAVVRVKPDGSSWSWQGYSCNLNWRNYTTWAGAGYMQLCDGWSASRCSDSMRFWGA